MFDLFLDDGDLLEAVEMDMILNESYIEEGVKIDKSRLNDIEYVKSVIKEIKHDKNKKEMIATALMFFGAFSVMTIIGIPVGILIILLAERLLSNLDKVELKDLENVKKTTEKAISDLTKQYNSSTDKNEKKELKDTINKLEKTNKEIIKAMDKIKNPSKYKTKNKDAVESLDICVGKLKELLSKPKYSDLKNAIEIDVNITGNYNEFIYGEHRHDGYLDIAVYDTDKLHKLIDSDDKYEDWDDINKLMEDLINDVNKSLKGEYELWFSEDSDMWHGGFAIMLK